MRIARALGVLAVAAGLQQPPSQAPSKARAAPLALDSLSQQHQKSEVWEELWIPCDRQPQGRCLEANLIFIRVFKTASSSFSGILRRIGAYHGVNGIHQWTAKGLPEPVVSTDHFNRREFGKQVFVQELGKFSKRNIFVTFVRAPLARELSAYYWRRSVDDFHDSMLAFLKQIKHNFMLNFLSKSDEISSHAEPGKVLADYDFVGVTERFDESVVALMFALGLKSYCELLFTDAKSSTSGTDRHGERWIPHRTLEQQPPEVRQYIASPEFQNKIAKDKELYHLANERLDKLIDKIGRPLFKRRLEEFAHLKNASQTQCDADGKSEFDPKNCYVSDLGCNYKCLDAFCHKHQKDMTPKDTQ